MTLDELTAYTDARGDGGTWDEYSWGEIFNYGESMIEVGPEQRDTGLKLTRTDQIQSVRHMWSESGDYAEMDAVGVFELQDGAFITIHWWTDTTGWGCQDDVNVKWARTYEEIVEQGLDNAERKLLGIELTTEG